MEEMDKCLQDNPNISVKLGNFSQANDGSTIALVWLVCETVASATVFVCFLLGAETLSSLESYDNLYEFQIVSSTSHRNA